MTDTKKASIGIRVEGELKDDAHKLFDELGLSMSSAITLFLKASVRHGGIPFDLSVKNDEKNT